MRVDMRAYPGTRDAVHAGIAALRVQGRQIWGDDKLTLPEIVTRLTVGIGDLARIVRDRSDKEPGPLQGEDSGALPPAGMGYRSIPLVPTKELKKELGNIIFSTIRWIDDLGLDVLECLDLAIEAQEKFAGSGRPR